MALAVRMTGISKAFGALRAVSSVDLQVEKGTMHAIVGENGAGKTTLMRILYGATKADSGQIEVDGVPVTFHSSAEAISHGVGMVSQHYGIIPGLTALQNLMLGTEPGAVLNLKAAERRAEELARGMGFTFDWSTQAESLSPASCQKLEILRLLWKNARIMILDEPTAMLSPVDGDALFASLKRLVVDGATVILVTHRLPEVMDHCQRVSVMRAGEVIGDMAVVDTSARELANLIVGGELGAPQAKTKPSGEVQLEVSGLFVRGERGNTALSDVSFNVLKGEVVGIAGVDGSGQRELVRTLLGLARPTEGSIRMDGHEITHESPAERLRNGLRVLPEDRISEAEIETWSLELNAALGLQRLPALKSGQRVKREARKSLAAGIAERFHTRHAGLNSPISSLSGGNQQRFIAARTLALSPSLIVAFQPARGLDLHGARAVYDGIRAECEAGAAALIISFDLDEILENCDRVLTLFNGNLFATEAGKERDREAIGRLMVGAS